MAEYSITFGRSARKELENLPPSVAERILEKAERLFGNPRPPGVIKLQGTKNLWQLRVGDYGVFYSVNAPVKTFDVPVVRHRRDVYRDL